MTVAKNQSPAAKPRTRSAKTAAATSAAAAKKAAARKSAEPENPAESEKPVEPEKRAAAEKPTESEKPTPAGKPTQAAKPAKPAKPAQPAPSAAKPGNRVSVTIPLDSALAGVALKAATLPVSAAKKVAQNRNGIPAYVAVGGLAVIGAVEWPVAAVGGLSLAALRRWGPLKPAEKGKN